MIITKEFEGEMAHIVRNCSTERCKRSIHGHSYKVLVSLTASKLDNAGMIYDFGLMKGSIKQFIDSFDHCTVFWNQDDKDYIESIKRHSDRWISLPFNPSAEMLSLFLLSAIQGILQCTQTNNGEDELTALSVQYYETRTGSATSFVSDLLDMPNIFGVMTNGETKEGTIQFSTGVTKDWGTDLWNWYLKGKSSYKNPNEELFINPKVDQQV